MNSFPIKGSKHVKEAVEGNAKGRKKLGTLGQRAKNENKVKMKDATAGGGRAEFRSRGKRGGKE